MAFVSDETSWYQDRLENPELLDQAVDTSAGLAIPVGGTRRGGYVSVEDAKHGQEVIGQLSTQDGFPNVRLIPSDDDEAMDVVRWGDNEPALPAFDDSDLAWARSDVDAGRMYGYREEAIRAYVADSWSADLADEAMRASAGEPS